MSNRLDFDAILRSLLGSDNVYYQPPESVKMKYTAIKYSVNDVYNRNADNLKYSKKTRYEVVVISKKPDDPVIDKILELPYSSYDRHYNSDGLNHDVITVYY